MACRESFLRTDTAWRPAAVAALQAALLLCLVFPARAVPGAAPAAVPVDSLRQRAQAAYGADDYDAAVRGYEALLGAAPAPADRRLAVRMLGMINDHNLFRLDDALRWYRTYLDEYAAADRITQNIQRRVSLLSGLGPHRDAFVAFQRAKLMEQFSPERCRALETIVHDYPDYDKLYEVWSVLAWEYRQAGAYGKSYRAFRRALTDDPATSPDQAAAQLREPWMVWMLSLGAAAGWVLLALIWAGTLWLRPWKDIGRERVRRFLPWLGGWTALSLVLLGIYVRYIRHFLENPFSITDVAVLLGSGLAVLLWIMLFTATPWYRGGARTARAGTYIVIILFTLVHFYLFLYHRPGWIRVMADFGERYGEFLHLHGGRGE